MTQTFMRVNKKLLEQLKARKQVARESYSDVVSRLIKEDMYKDLPVKKYTSDQYKFLNKMKGKKGQSMMPSGF